MSTTQVKTEIREGTWTADTAHSSASFAVEHAGLSVFRGGFKPVDAGLTVSGGNFALDGSVEIASISVDDDNIRPHLLSPEFFDAERNPSVRFQSTEISGEPDDLRVSGELSMAGFALPVTARGRLRGPIEAPGGGQKLALALEAVIDRTDFGMNWQMELPSGGAALANEVKLVVDLELNRS
ncbi:MAG: YceI family protein [Actinomycetota bacterium]|nr:YceI family protein [Actinomycetota bacterium]